MYLQEETSKQSGKKLIQSEVYFSAKNFEVYPQGFG